MYCRTERRLDRSGISIAPPKREHAATTTIAAAPTRVGSARIHRIEQGSSKSDTNGSNDSNKTNEDDEIEYGNNNGKDNNNNNNNNNGDSDDNANEDDEDASDKDGTNKDDEIEIEDGGDEIGDRGAQAEAKEQRAHAKTRERAHAEAMDPAGRTCSTATQAKAGEDPYSWIGIFEGCVLAPL